ncbi:PD-(D/E)XK nuclease family protein [Candidatus Woesearchaeota archaeon]|nr:PD-(D/E)XK nuclease family protein [Candidatus Woesearchaeota archaeon]
MIYSPSRLSTFETCPLKFRFQYIDKIETPEEEGVEAFLGSRVHETLEKLYKDLKFLKENSLQDLLDYFDKQWNKNWNDSIIIVHKEYTPENYRKLGVKYVTDYYNRFKPFNQDKTIATERRITIKLDDKGEYKMQGYIDRIAYKDGYYEVHDYKTNANLPLEEYLIRDRQLSLYSIALLKDYQDAKKVKQVWHFLAFDKDVTLEKNKKELEQLRKDTIALIKKIEASKKRNDFPAQTSRLCDWCEFKPQCPEWKHLYKLEDKPANEYLKEDGVTLVNKYAALDSKYKKLKQELEEQIEKIKEALIAYAKKEQVEVVYGSDMKAKVKIEEKLKFPGKNDEQSEELKQLLKTLGRWEEVEMLDNYALLAMIKNGKLDTAELKKLKKFETKETSESVRLSKFSKEEED